MTHVIDAHLHVWNPSAGYAWLKNSPKALQRPFTIGDAHAQLCAAEIDSAILVQADNTVADTEAMFESAAQAPWVVGVVGWLPLDDPASARRQLERWMVKPKFCGVRHLVHADALREAWEAALTIFGPARLMYGGDWSMTEPFGGYQATYSVIRRLIDELSPPEREALLIGTAQSVYRDGARPAAATTRSH